MENYKRAYEILQKATNFKLLKENGYYILIEYEFCKFKAVPISKSDYELLWELKHKDDEVNNA